MGSRAEHWRDTVAYNSLETDSICAGPRLGAFGHDSTCSWSSLGHHYVGLDTTLPMTSQIMGLSSISNAKNNMI